MSQVSADETRARAAIAQSHLRLLPTPLTALVGREREIEHVRALLTDPVTRLVTISGFGGVGKTRLALQLAHDAASRASFPDGVFFVPMAGVMPHEPLDEVLATTIATALGAPLSGVEPASVQLASYLRECCLLLVLDNIEHLIAATALLGNLLPTAPGVVVLATSRERLNLHGEQVVALSGLAVPPEGVAEVPELAASPAVQLFAEVARSVAVDFALDATNASDVAAICRMVDGLPLAIELAARWTPVLSCAEIVGEIGRSLDFLTDDTRRADEERKSLRAVFAHSWALLSADEQVCLRRLAVFRGSFTRHAAAEVSDASLPLLAALMNKSLVRRVPGIAGAASRYELPGSLRQYAEEQLDAAGERETVLAGFATVYGGLLAEQLDNLRGAQQIEALATLRAEIDQIRLAWHHAVARSNHTLLGAAAPALFHLYDMLSWFTEGAAIFAAASRALDADRNQPDVAAVYAACLARQAWFSFHDGRQREARAMFEQSLAIQRQHGHETDRVFVLNYLAVVCAYLGDYRTGERFGAEGLTLAEARGDAHGRAVASNILGQIAYDQGDYSRARRYSEQSLMIERQTRNGWSMTFSLTNLGKVAYAEADYEAARRMFTESLERRQALGDSRGEAICHHRLGDTAAALGDGERAEGHYRQSLALFQRIGNRWGQAAVRISQGEYAIRRRHTAEAVPLLQEALHLALETGSLPQAAIVARLCASLARPHDPQWASELEQLAARPSAELLGQQAARLLSWHYHKTVAAPARAVGEPGRQSYPGGLTAREVEVLRLVARGLTDAQVADELVLSKRTVSTHLTSIYGKLGISSRSAATRFAIEHGFL
jgi:predicted ATPase/DNA-binding NarL/FixJ family response regulator